MRTPQSLFACLLLISCVTACGGSDTLSPEQKVQEALNEIELGVESRSLSQVMDRVSEDYKDHKGNDKRAVAQLVQLQILRNQNINLFTLIRSIEVSGDTASVELSAAMAAKEVDLSIESNRLRADAYQFSVSLSHIDGQWLVQSVSWQRGW